ncbi:hypothetical protein DM02DRAFT_585818 [Periconia macrospinosa]|uniref:4'-phosphopantetheinyl transferase domain-containing protein n=1 Tax=Periconia macrospinosa TaxID=97972 RepID=A0A2V1E1U1_9PLEO|nr:hypothetical protein DM02DRAFT_585818 [Periconia macrospinosa]
MPPRPFPLPLRVGTDICSISRIRKILAPAEGTTIPRLERFLPKLLTWPERQYFGNRFGSHEPSSNHALAIAQFIAGRYSTSRPQGLILRERLTERLISGSESNTTFDVNSVDGQLCEISISHDTDWAVATAIVPTFETWNQK